MYEVKHSERFYWSEIFLRGRRWLTGCRAKPLQGSTPPQTLKSFSPKYPLVQLSLKTFGNEGKQLESYRPFLFQGLGNLDEPACSGTSDAPGKGRLKAGQLEQQGEVSWLKTLTHGVVFVLLRPYKIFGSFALEGPLTSVILLEIPHSTASAQSRRLGGIASNKPCKRPTMSQVTKLLLQSLASTVVFQEHFLKPIEIGTLSLEGSSNLFQTSCFLDQEQSSPGSFTLAPLRATAAVVGTLPQKRPWSEVRAAWIKRISTIVLRKRSCVRTRWTGRARVASTAGRPLCYSWGRTGLQGQL